MTYNIYKMGVASPVASIQIMPPPQGISYHDIQWDSKTGIVSALIAMPGVPEPTKRTAIPYTGIGCVMLEPGYYFCKANDELGANEGSIHGLNYHYWYY